MDTATEYSQVHWPQNQQIRKLNENEPHTNRKKLHTGNLQKTSLYDP